MRDLTHHLNPALSGSIFPLATGSYESLPVSIGVGMEGEAIDGTLSKLLDCAECHTPELRQTGILSVHGLASNKEATFSRRGEQVVLPFGATSLRISLRDQGESIASYTLSRAVEDVMSGIDLLRVQGMERIIVAANSFGAQAALIAAQEREDISKLILLAPLTDLGAHHMSLLTDEVIAIWEQQGQIPFPIAQGKTVNFGFGLYKDLVQFQTSSDYSRISCDVTAIFAEQDEALPYKPMLNALDGVERLTKEIIDDADHSFTALRAKHAAMTVFDLSLKKALLEKMG